MEALAESLSALALGAFRWSAAAFLLLNGIAAAVVWIARDRRIVDRWTSPLLALNLFLLGTGVGVPAIAYSMGLVVEAVSSTAAPMIPALENQGQ